MLLDVRGAPGQGHYALTRRKAATHAVVENFNDQAQPDALTGADDAAVDDGGAALWRNEHAGHPRWRQPGGRDTLRADMWWTHRITHLLCRCAGGGQQQQCGGEPFHMLIQFRDRLSVPISMRMWLVGYFS